MWRGYFAAADNPGVGIQEIPNAGAWASGGQLTDHAVYFISGCRRETARTNSQRLDRL